MLCSNQLSYVATISCRDQRSRRGAHFPPFCLGKSRFQAGLFLAGLPLDVEAKMYNVAVLYHVVLALQAPATGVLGALFAIVLDEVVIADNLGADETLLEVSVDDAGGFRGGGADLHRPCAHFLNTGGEVGLQLQ